MMYLNRKVGRLNYRIALKVDKHIDNKAFETPCILQSDRTIFAWDYESYYDSTSYSELKDPSTNIFLWYIQLRLL